MFEIPALIIIAILIFSIVVHEVAHGLMADKLGDPTARLQGRITLNPLPHLDVFGSIIVPGILWLSSSGFLFGWAKPVPYNPYNLRGRFAEAWVAVAGPLSNIGLALIAGGILRLTSDPALAAILVYAIFINCILAIFNLLPIPPLDGSKILFNFLPSRFYPIREALERSGFILVILFVFLGWRLIAPIAYGLASLIGGF